MWQLIASGEGWNLASVVGYEDEVAEGQRGKLTLSLQNPLSPAIAEDLQSQLDAQGVTEAQVNTYGNNVDVTYRKGFPWLPVIVAVILGLIVLAILIVSWLFYKEAPLGFSLLALGGILFGAAALIYVVRRQT